MEEPMRKFLAVLSLVLPMVITACEREVVVRFQVAGWHNGNPARKNIQFLVNGDPIGPIIRYGASTGSYDVKIITGRAYGGVTGPSDNIYSAQVTLGVRDANTGVIFLTTRHCTLYKERVTNFTYTMRYDNEELYCD